MPAKANKTLVVVCGPTAVGKTDFAIRLAEQYRTEIISADSRQIYREIPIGTAQPSKEEQNRVKHHFIAQRSITEDFNAGIFEREALSRLENLFQVHNTIVCCGGTGLYIKALCQGLDEVPKADESLRQELNERLQTDGLESLQSQLQSLDPVHYNRMDQQNPQRVIRALEVCISSGKPFSSFHAGEKQERPFRILKIGLELPREELNARIDNRVDVMLGQGWLEEAKSVFEKRELNALNTVGYKELFAHLAGEMNLQEAIEKIEINTRRFAKRQMTWFKNDADITWFEKPTLVEVLELLD
jgi:tRNA dimethylallyltransferase